MTKNSKQTWPWGRGYRMGLQTPEQIDDVLALLGLEGTEAMVDIGCGNGVFAIAAARRFPQCRVWACDPLDSAIAECTQLAGDLPARNFQAFVAPAEEIPLPDACADRILMRNVLHHVGDVEAAFGQIGRLLRPGGRVVVEGPVSVHDRATRRFLTELNLFRDSSHRRRYYRPERILQWLEAAGVQVESVKFWVFPTRLGPRLVEYVRQHTTDEKLRLHQRGDGTWFIDGNMLRVVAAKTGPAEGRGMLAQSGRM